MTRSTSFGKHHSIGFVWVTCAFGKQHSDTIGCNSCFDLRDLYQEKNEDFELYDDQGRVGTHSSADKICQSTGIIGIKLWRLQRR